MCSLLVPSFCDIRLLSASTECDYPKSHQMKSAEWIEWSEVMSGVGISLVQDFAAKENVASVKPSEKMNARPRHAWSSVDSLKKLSKVRKKDNIPLTCVLRNAERPNSWLVVLGRG